MVVAPRDGHGPSAVVEMKFVRPGESDDAMRRAADEAMSQISGRRYFADLTGEVRLYGISVRQTDVSVSYRTVNI